MMTCGRGDGDWHHDTDQNITYMVTLANRVMMSIVMMTSRVMMIIVMMTSRVMMIIVMVTLLF